MYSPPFTVAATFVRGMLSGNHVDAATVPACLQQAGIAQALFEQTSGRVTAEQYVTLFSAVMKRCNDEGLGFFSRPLRTGSTALVMRSALSAATVDSAVRRLCRALDLIQDDMQFQIVREEQFTGVRIAMLAASGPAPVFVHELLLRLLARITVWLHGGRLRSHGFDFPYPAPAHAIEYALLFPGRKRFDQARSVVWFPTASLAMPMRRDEAALRSFLLQSPRNLVVPHRSDELTSDRIRTHLQQVRPQWPGLPATAEALNMSVSTLQRHLDREGSSFQQVKDHLRRDLAIVRLKTTTVQLATLAAELGFSDQSVFQRAFKTWTGSAPGNYRERS